MSGSLEGKLRGTKGVPSHAVESAAASSTDTDRLDLPRHRASSDVYMFPRHGDVFGYTKYNPDGVVKIGIAANGRRQLVGT